MEQIRDELLHNPQTNYPSFNGYYSRDLVSPYGKVEGIPIPRFRNGFSGEPPTILNGFEDEKREHGDYFTICILWVYLNVR